MGEGPLKKKETVPSRVSVLPMRGATHSLGPSRKGRELQRKGKVGERAFQRGKVPLLPSAPLTRRGQKGSVKGV